MWFAASKDCGRLWPTAVGDCFGQGSCTAAPLPDGSGQCHCAAGWEPSLDLTYVQNCAMHGTARRAMYALLLAWAVALAIRRRRVLGALLAATSGRGPDGQIGSGLG